MSYSQEQEAEDYYLRVRDHAEKCHFRAVRGGGLMRISCQFVVISNILIACIIVFSFVWWNMVLHIRNMDVFNLTTFLFLTLKEH